MKLRKIFSFYTLGFLTLVILVGILEYMDVFGQTGIVYIFMAFSIGVYALIGVITRTSDPAEYYVAGRGVPAIFNGMATGSDWMSAASFISMAGLLFKLGYEGLAYIMGWTGGYVLLALLLAPYLRKFGQFTVPDFLGARYEGNATRVIGIICAVLVSFTYLTGQLKGVGILVSRFIGIPPEPAVYLGLLGVLVCSFLGGMRAVTWTQVSQYIVLITAYLLPVIILSWRLFSVPIPQLYYGQVLEKVDVMEKMINNEDNPNPKGLDGINEKISPEREAETRSLWKAEAEQLTKYLEDPEGTITKMRERLDRDLASLAPDKIQARKERLEEQKATALEELNKKNLSSDEKVNLSVRVTSLDAQLSLISPEQVENKTARTEKAISELPKTAEEAVAKWTAQLKVAKGQSKTITRYLGEPIGANQVINFLGLMLCLMLGTAGLPHILTRYYTTPTVKEARASVGWSLFFIFLLYFSAPAYAAFARYEVFTGLIGTSMTDLPSWIASWKTVGLLDVIDKNKDGIVQFADFIIKSTDFVVLATPEIAGLPYTITGLVMAGGLAAALSTADGLLLTIANAISHDLYYKVINPNLTVEKRVRLSKFLLLIIAILCATFAAYVKLPVVAKTVAWAFSYAASSIFPALVLGIWWPRATKQGAIAGMISGLTVSIYYSFAQFWGYANWFDIGNAASGLFGVPVAMIVMVVVSLMTPTPSKKLRDFVISVRYPRGSQKGVRVDAQVK